MRLAVQVLYRMEYGGITEQQFADIMDTTLEDAVIICKGQRELSDKEVIKIKKFLGCGENA